MFQGKYFSYLDDFAVSFFNISGCQDIVVKYFRIRNRDYPSVLVRNGQFLGSQMSNIIRDHHTNHQEKIDSIVISSRLAIYMFFCRYILPSSLENATLTDVCPDGNKAIMLLMKVNKETLLTYVVNELDISDHHDAEVFWVSNGKMKSKSWRFRYK